MHRMRKPKHSFNKVILIVADTLRQLNLEDRSPHRAKTPNLDYLKTHGVSFSNAYTTNTKTCPSIVAIMSGNYPIHSGLVNHINMWGENLIKAKEEKNIHKIRFIQEDLKKDGYKTAAVDWMGLWYKRAFDYYSGKLDNPTSFILRLKQHPVLSRLKEISVRLLRREFIHRAYYCFYVNPKGPYDSADKVFKRGIELLERNKNKKMFLYLHLWDTHFPHTRPRGLKSYLFNTVDDTYNAEIEFIDKQMGELIDSLKKRNEINETLIVFTSDHGENFYESGTPFSHDMLYDNVVKIPLIFSSPQFEKKDIESLAQNIDIMPTILELLNIKIKSRVDGISLAPFFYNSKRGIRDYIYCEDIIEDKKLPLSNKSRRRCIRLGDYKFIETIAGSKGELTQIMPSGNLKIINRELYNLKKDPREKNNVLSLQRKIAEELEGRLHNLIQGLNFKRLNTNADLKKKVEKSIKTIKDSLKKYPADKIAIAWTGGKDSTVLLHLIKLAFNGKVPFKVIFNDSTMEFDEIYKFIEKIEKDWNLNLITIKHSKKELREFEDTKDRERQKELSRLMKITAINSVVKKYKLKAFIAGIRWDEHESRSKEKYFSKRKDHDRIHPILHFTEKDIWDYIHHFGVPYVNLYSKGYRSLGEKPFTKKAEEGGGERSGREREKEKLMENLRKLGYW
jgi:phosphoadenosine phosphosulfate reductase